MEKQLLKINEALPVLGISRSAFYRDVAKKRLRLVKVGKSSRVTPDECLRWVACRVAEAEANAA